jgi:hypothetical protein
MNRTFQTLTLVAVAAAGIATGFGIGRATSPTQKDVKAAQAATETARDSLAKATEQANTLGTQATFWEATSKARAEELSRVTAALTLCNARPTTNTGKIKNNVRVK